MESSLGEIEIWSEPTAYKGRQFMIRFTIKEATAKAFSIPLDGQKLLIFDKKGLTDILIVDFAEELTRLVKKGKKK